MNYYNENDPKAAAWLRELIKQQRIPNGIVDPRSITDVDPSDLEQYAQCHFFAGIGGWSYALQLADWPTDRQVWTGSCPCQPFSIAGKGLGEGDPRHLWPAFFRLIAQCQPPVIFGEQVASKAGKLWLAGVRADLETLVYRVGAADLCAAGVGAPHIRQRLFWVADHHSQRFGTPGSRERASEEPDSQHSRSSRRLAHTERDGRWSDEPQWGKEGRVIDGRSCRMANLQLSRLERLAGYVDGGNEPGREQAEQTGSITQSSSPSRVDNPTDGRTLVAGQTQPSCVRQNHGILRSPSGMGDTESGGCGVVRDETLARNSGHTLIPSWSRFELIWCRDNKARRIESGTFPLAHGVPGRVGLLRGYGNAIVPTLAAEFVNAYLTI